MLAFGSVPFSPSWPFLRREQTAGYAKVVIILWSPLTTQPNEGDSSTILRLQALPIPTRWSIPALPALVYACLWGHV